jgi:hypothetical protein
MPLQNRVTPFSTIEVSPARGLFTGNRGILHNDRQELVTTNWRHKAWIICELEYKGLRRKLMQPGHWTELFFLDEATALAAGHRPCALCRRAAYNQFLKLSGRASAKQLDETLHPQRTNEQSTLRFESLPENSFYAIGSEAFLKRGASSLLWSQSGYQPADPPSPKTLVQPLTPLLTRQVLAQGYQPILHPSAQ